MCLVPSQGVERPAYNVSPENEQTCTNVRPRVTSQRDKVRRCRVLASEHMQIGNTSVLRIERHNKVTLQLGDNFKLRRVIVVK
jgi:hypothetical protein